MAEIVKHYFEPGWRTHPVTCVCGWQGESAAMVMQLHEEVTDYACPDCESTLLIVSHPDLQQVKLAAADGNAEAQQQLALVREALASHRKPSD
jgi:hypothetical protein